MGPRFDLSKIWDEHTLYEFGTRDVAATMATMVAEPYVNHVPTMTGGVGARDLSRFYANHFIPKTPADTRLVPISRTIGADRLVDEMLFCFTHDIEIDWMLPGVKPTGKYVEIPLVSIVNFRGGKLYHEHIYWDQASVLVQIGVLDPNGLPIAGIETAKKLVDETMPSNTLMARWPESAGRNRFRPGNPSMPLPVERRHRVADRSGAHVLRNRLGLDRRDRRRVREARGADHGPDHGPHDDRHRDVDAAESLIVAKQRDRRYRVMMTPINAPVGFTACQPYENA